MVRRIVLLAWFLLAIPCSAQMGPTGRSTAFNPVTLNPNPGAVWGFTHLAFSDNFSSLSTIDVNDTRAAGFNWYVHNAWPNSTFYTGTGWQSAASTQAGDLSITNSVLTIGTDRSGKGEGISTAAASPSGSGYVGTVFSGGFYTEISFSFNPALVNGQASWPAFWSNPIEFLTQGNSTWTELDFVEQKPNPSNTTVLQSIMWMAQWQITSNTLSTVASLSNALSVIGLGTVDFTQQHRYGTLFVPSSLNGGTGLIQRYFDGYHLLSLDVSYSSGGNYSQLDTQHAVIIVGAGPSWPINVSSVKVWQ